MSVLAVFVLALIFAWALICLTYWASTGFNRHMFWTSVSTGSVVSVIGSSGLTLVFLVVVL